MRPTTRDWCSRCTAPRATASRAEGHVGAHARSSTRRRDVRHRERGATSRVVGRLPGARLRALDRCDRRHRLGAHPRGRDRRTDRERRARREGHDASQRHRRAARRHRARRGVLERREPALACVRRALPEYGCRVLRGDRPVARRSGRRRVPRRGGGPPARRAHRVPDPRGDRSQGRSCCPSPRRRTQRVRARARAHGTAVDRAGDGSPDVPRFGRSHDASARSVRRGCSSP